MTHNECVCRIIRSIQLRAVQLNNSSFGDHINRELNNDNNKPKDRLIVRRHTHVR